MHVCVFVIHWGTSNWTSQRAWGDTSGKTQGVSWWLGKSLEVLVWITDLEPMIIYEGPLARCACASTERRKKSEPADGSGGGVSMVLVKAQLSLGWSVWPATLLSCMCARVCVHACVCTCILNTCLASTGKDTSSKQARGQKFPRSLSPLGLASQSFSHCLSSHRLFETSPFMALQMGKLPQHCRSNAFQLLSSFYQRNLIFGPLRVLRKQWIISLCQSQGHTEKVVAAKGDDLSDLLPAWGPCSFFSFYCLHYVGKSWASSPSKSVAHNCYENCLMSMKSNHFRKK